LTFFDTLLVRRIAEQLPQLSACSVKRLLDVGTGTGQFLKILRANPRFDDFDVLAVDYFTDMLELAVGTVGSIATPLRPRLLAADAQALPFDDRTIGLLLSRSTMHHFADPVSALREMYRVLCPGGVAVIHDVRRDAPAKALDHFNALRRQAGVEPCRLDEKYTPDDLRSMAAAAGLSEQSRVSVSDSGYASLGMELFVAKPPLTSEGTTTSPTSP
jgi:ubiquinone/menaquinone biosynthesis C-methylase UbiE